MYMYQLNDITGPNPLDPPPKVESVPSSKQFGIFQLLMIFLLIYILPLYSFSIFFIFPFFLGRYLYPIGSINFYFRSRKSQNWVVDRTYRPFCIWKQVFFWVNNKYFLSQINNWRTIRSYVYEFIQNTCCKIGF